MSLVSAPFWHARGTGWPGRGHGLSGCKLLARPCWRSKHAARCICRRLLRMAVTRSGCCTSLLYGVALAGRNAVNLLLTYHTTCNGHFLERSRPVTFNTSRARSAHSFFGPKAERHAHSLNPCACPCCSPPRCELLARSCSRSNSAAYRARGCLLSGGQALKVRWTATLVRKVLSQLAI